MTTKSKTRNRVLRSTVTGRVYFTARVKDVGGGAFEASGRKIDVTADVQAMIDNPVREALDNKRAVRRKER